MSPVTSYDSAQAPSPVFGEIKELWRYRDLLLLLVLNSIKTRYKRSFFGVAWTLLNPLLHMAVMAAAFSAMFSSSLARYPVYVLAGLVCWNFFTQTTLHAMNNLVWGGGLLKRVYIPRTIFVFAAVGNGLVNLGVSLLPLLLIMLVLGHPFHSTWLFLPVAVFLLAIFSLGVALLISVLAVFFADVANVYQALLQALFFLTPVMYPQDILPREYAWCRDINPMHYFVEIFRAPIYAGVLPDAGVLAAAAGFALAAFLLGWWAFNRKVDEFAYRL